MRTWVRNLQYITRTNLISIIALLIQFWGYLGSIEPVVLKTL